MLTAGTYLKQHFFRQADGLSLVQDTLLALADEYGWHLQAWAIFSNHYHFVAISPNDPSNLPQLIRRLHAVTGNKANEMDGTRGRRVWFQYWDTRLTYERSYLARLNYVHQNPVHHGVVTVAQQYPWCSAGWFERAAEKSFYKTVSEVKIDRINVYDEFGAE